ncbi:hypothetical protein IV500_04460 [Paeniglutamicibacter antarcticus]|uniref:Uncharacterized protein n=1 Tax=Arthrobacter terrae TaxID=2935737 RepID=A0A931G4C9_9MICC|nr:hypothetical protein [Arthrobacter terrae]MBG0738673.1 hypothetical protein [Arthrobacter terrae]
MAAETKQLHPALQYLKDNVVVISLVVIVAVSIVIFAFTQNAPAAKPAASVAPTAVPTAALDTGAPVTGATSTSEATEDHSGSTASSTAPGGSQGGAQPSPSPTAVEHVVVGTGPQGVSAKDWRPYAEEFSKAWVNTADGKDAWLTRLKPMVSADLYAGFTRTDLNSVPAATYRSITLAEESLASKTFRAYSMNGQMFEGRVSVQPDGTWIVDQVGPPKK